MQKPWNYHNIAVSPEIYKQFAEIQRSMGSPKCSEVLKRLMETYQTFKVKPKCPTCGRLVKVDGDHRICSKCGSI